jgi:predicted ATPase
LRKSLGAGVLDTRAGGYAIAVTRDAVDAHRFEAAVKGFPAIGSLEGAPALHAALDGVDAALALWRGEALEDVADEDFARGEVVRLDELRWAAIERRIDLLLRLGRHGEAVGDLSELVQRAPLRERFHEQLVLALYRSGRQADALRAYDDARKILTEELGLDPGQALQDLERAVLQHDPALDWVALTPAPAAAPAPPTSTAAAPPPGVGRVPVPLSPLIGRDDELSRLRDLLAAHRALTLTGPAGAGKTRLAIGLATSTDEQVWYVDLSPIEDPSLVASACAAATGVAIAPGDDAARSIADTLATQHGLLVLDTCEHVLATAGQVAATVLRAASGVRVLATSRRALGLSGEFAWPVPPLALPPTVAVTSDDITAHAAVQLFVERARAVNPDLEVDDRAAADIAAICLTLDGLPLAIELAAARAELLSPAAIRERLTDRFDLLVGGGVDAAERQQTLRAAIDWSFELLTDDQRSFFARLGAFAGTFELDAALAVAGDSFDGPLDLLASLVKQSMVTRAGPDRYRLLDTLRAYALDALADRDADDTRDRHAEFFTVLAEEGELAIRGPDQLVWLDRFRSDVHNFRAALEWALLTGDTDRAARLAGALAWFWTLNGMLTEAIGHLERLVAVETTPAPIRARCVWGYALLAASLGRLVDARDAGYFAAHLGREGDDPVGAAYGLNAAAVAEWALGEHDRSLSAHSEAIDLLTPVGDEWGLAICKILRARTLFDLADDTAVAVAEEGVEHARRAGDVHVLGIALTQVAQHAIGDGDHVAAIAAASEALALQEQIGYTEGTVSALHVLGQAHRLAGDVDGARDLHRRALTLASRIGHAAATCEAMEDLARTEADTRPELAAEMLRAARRERDDRALPLRHRDAEELSALEASLDAADDGTAGRSVSSLVAELTS